MPFTPITTTRGFGFAPLGVWANRKDVVRSNDIANVLEALIIMKRTPKCGPVLQSYLRACC
jgi:hypothetical protein